MDIDLECRIMEQSGVKYKDYSGEDMKSVAECNPNFVHGDYAHYVSRKIKEYIVNYDEAGKRLVSEQDSISNKVEDINYLEKCIGELKPDVARQIIFRRNIIDNTEDKYRTGKTLKEVLRSNIKKYKDLKKGYALRSKAILDGNKILESIILEKVFDHDTDNKILLWINVRSELASIYMKYSKNYSDMADAKEKYHDILRYHNIMYNN